MVHGHSTKPEDVVTWRLLEKARNQEAAAALREQFVIGASKGIGLETPMQALVGATR
jgi:hypothetical protein